MAGSSLALNILYDDREVRQAFERLIWSAARLSPAFQDIGEHLLLSHRERWDRQQAPDGTPWEPLSDATLRRKMLKGVKRAKGATRKSLTGRGGATKAGALRALVGAQALVESGDLRDLLRYEASGQGLEVGTDRPYGATHQFGRPEAGIPARPWLGLSGEDRREVLAILARHLEETIAGR